MIVPPSTPARVVLLIVMPLLAGVGLAEVLAWLPETLTRVAVAVLVLGVFVWAIREARWAKRMQHELEADMERLRELGG